jgi:hypothetical protein
MGWLTSPKRIFLPDKIRIVFLIIAVCAFWLTELGRFVYRPYVRINGIQDFGLADSVGNLGGIIVQIFFVCAVINPKKIHSYRWAVFLSIGYVVYEIVQPYLPRGVFDWKDIFGTLIGFVISLILLWIIWSKLPPKEETKSD